MSSPTARSLAECRKRGWEAQVVERPPTRYVPRRADLFGCIDIVAITDTGILGIQATDDTDHAKRMTKARQEPRMAAWLRFARFEVWSWGKRGARGERKLWTLRREELLVLNEPDSP